MIEAAAAAALAWALWADAGHTTAPRDAIVDAYIEATEQLHALELDAALHTIDRAIATARSEGLGTDPSLAILYAMRAGLLLALRKDDDEVYVACLQGLRLDPLVEVPIELRSGELRAICERARGEAPAPSGDIVHSPPDALADRDLEFTVVVGVPIPEDAQVVLYWRRAGTSSPYVAIEMGRLGNSGRAILAADEHRGADLEYFVYAFDGNAQAIANVGDREQPLVLRMLAPVPEVRRAEVPDDARPSPIRQLPRVILSLGVGTGLGVARGRAEQTYAQFLDLDGYSTREQACAIARWQAGNAAIPGTAAELEHELGMLPATMLPLGDPTPLVAAYDPASCGARHPVDPGLASAPLHLEPEVAVRVHRGLYLAAFARLQVVTGSQVFTEDPTLEANKSFEQEVTSTSPPGTRRRPPFTWAVGIELKYMFGDPSRRLHPLLGAFAGYGTARLRVPLGFANDRNGNSVPDDCERAAVGPLDTENLIDPTMCTPVWPYNDGCSDPAAMQRAQAVTAATPRGDQRVDTIALGPGFGGVLAGLHYRVTKRFALGAELKLGAWFPRNATILADLTVGPALTF